MFEHLDDSEPYRPDPALRTTVVSEGRRRRRRHRLAGAVGGATVLVVAVVAGTLLYVDHRVSRIQRIDVAGLPDDQPARGAAATVLFVGVDTDEGLPADAPERAGRDVVTGARTDTMLLARVDPGANTVTVLPVPRDLWVDIPGHGPQRINQAFELGGPSLLIETLRSSLGIDVDRYVQTDFVGAKNLADRLGGLRVSFAHPVRDGHVGLDLAAGCQTLDGQQALQLVRSRDLQQQVDGLWQRDPTSAFGRMERQEAVATSVLAQVASVDAGNPAQLAALVDAATSNLTIDAGTTPGELLDLVRAVVGSDVQQVRLPVIDAIHGGRDTVDLGPSWSLVVDAFRSGAPLASQPRDAAGPAAPTGVILPAPC